MTSREAEPEHPNLAHNQKMSFSLKTYKYIVSSQPMTWGQGAIRSRH